MHFESPVIKGYLSFFCHFSVIFLSFPCHFSVIYLSHYFCQIHTAGIVVGFSTPIKPFINSTLFSLFLYKLFFWAEPREHQVESHWFSIYIGKRYYRIEFIKGFRVNGSLMGALREPSTFSTRFPKEKPYKKGVEKVRGSRSAFKILVSKKTSIFSKTLYKFCSV